jgi:hypothetical protein
VGPGRRALTRPRRRERADLLGGSFEAGPEASPDRKNGKGHKDGKGGAFWTVRAVLPLSRGEPE